jgi:hypothetical protein
MVPCRRLGMKNNPNMFNIDEESSVLDIVILSKVSMILRRD